MVRLHHVRGIASVSELKKRSGQESLHLDVAAVPHRQWLVRGMLKLLATAVVAATGIDADHRRCFWALQRVPRRRQERAVPGAAIHWTSARPTAAGSPPIPGPEHPILGAVIGRIVSAITLRNDIRICG